MFSLSNSTLSKSMFLTSTLLSIYYILAFRSNYSFEYLRYFFLLDFYYVEARALIVTTAFLEGL